MNNKSILIASFLVCYLWNYQGYLEPINRHVPPPLKPLGCLCSLQENMRVQSLCCPPHTADDLQSACGQSQ